MNVTERIRLPFLTELVSKVKPFDASGKKRRSRQAVKNTGNKGNVRNNGNVVLWHSYNAIERRRRLFHTYTIDENDHAVRRLRNSKPFSCGNVFEIRVSKSRDIQDEKGKVVAVRLRDKDSDGKEMIYSLGGW
jgi:hypothetical protein